MRRIIHINLLRSMLLLKKAEFEHQAEERANQAKFLKAHKKSHSLDKKDRKKSHSLEKKKTLKNRPL